MGHPGLLIQDYVAGIPIWYNPNNEHRNHGKDLTSISYMF
jgi:hypothetical protein